MTAATAESPTRIGWVPVPEHALNRADRSLTVAPARLGPLLAVCGLAGGAGVTTLSYLIALAAVRQWTDPVLVADTGGPSGGLAACAGVEVERSLERARPAARRRGAARRRHLRDRAGRTARPRDRTRVLLAPGRRPS